MRKNIGWVFMALVCFISCKDQYDICDTPRTVQLNGGFYHRMGGTETVNTAPAFTLSVLGTNLNLYDQQAGLQKFNLQLNQISDTAKYFVRLNNSTGADTVTIVYYSQLVTLPEPCGIITTNTLTSVKTTRHSIDTVTIVNPAVGTTGAQNIKLYF
ncbi:MAG: DUF6452 family protein [Ferruginibacter sp.]